MTEEQATYTAGEMQQKFSPGDKIFWMPRSGFCRLGPCTGDKGEIMGELVDGHYEVRTKGHGLVLALPGELTLL